jgi:hypothetical protein
VVNPRIKNSWIDSVNLVAQFTDFGFILCLTLSASPSVSLNILIVLITENAQDYFIEIILYLYITRIFVVDMHF